MVKVLQINFRVHSSKCKQLNLFACGKERLVFFAAPCHSQKISDGIKYCGQEHKTGCSVLYPLKRVGDLNSDLRRLTTLLNENSY